MRLYYAVLSGAHATLPAAELRGILEALGHRYRVVEELDLLTVFRCSCPGSRGVAYRAGMVQETGRVLAVAEASIDALLAEAELIDWCSEIPQGARGVRFELRRLRGYARNTVPGDAARRVAAAAAPALRRCGLEPTPRGDTRIRIIVSEGLAVIGLLEDEKPDKLLEQHRPQKRPFFHPGSLDPRLARVFLNLSRAAPPGPYLDPFCGTGGFTLEAQELGIPSICGELAPRLAHGAKVNLNAYPGSHAAITIAQWDATSLPLRGESIQSIGTDPPYGRSISLRGKRLEDLLRGFLHEAARVLKPGAHLAYAAPHWADNITEDYTREAGLEPIEKHYMRVHGSLTRIITVARKP